MGRFWACEPWKKCLIRARQQEQARRPPALAVNHTEQRLAADAVGAAYRTRSGAEQPARTTAVATLAAVQNGTSGVIAGTHHFK